MNRSERRAADKAAKKEEKKTIGPCSAIDCPLVQNNIIHEKGKYLYNGVLRDPSQALSIAIAFAKCNPPPFIWEACSRYKELTGLIEAMKKDCQDTTALEREKSQKETLCMNFLKYHSGCNTCPNCYMTFPLMAATETLNGCNNM